ncbi:MAG: DUF4954 family protein [Ferruginibacter sp.]
MNIINKYPINKLGHDFIEPEYLPKGKDEYYLRFEQTKSNNVYRNLTSLEIEVLVRNRNQSNDWNSILVSASFNPELVKNCHFSGLIRIGKLEPLYLEFHNLRLPVGLYNSTIISSDFGDNVSIYNVDYLSHYIIGNEVMIANVNELACTSKAKFGNGFLHEGEPDKNRVWMELSNENGGRRVIPFDGMLSGDAYLWSRYRDNIALTKRFIEFIDEHFDNRRGYYGTIGDRTVIKHCKIIKDVKIGSDAYLKGANKLKNLTINSDAKRTSQIGEGCEMVNGIVGYGCRIFYGVKAVRFIMAAHSQLKYGARLLNSYLGNNATISCCEVLNSLIFPAHEQHHNNSFLCASTVMGQSNIAAGATIGSNHNSRSADGEIIAGRGFWPGLCVSLKHNSKFASFTIIAKGDFPAELNIPIPFSLISNDVSHDRLIVMPGYWFMYNMYALERNASKYVDRDKRTTKIQRIEFDYLAPDTINELFSSLSILTKLQPDEKDTATVEGWENAPRKTTVLKVNKSIALFKELIQFYATMELMKYFNKEKFKDFDTFKKSLSAKLMRSEWVNVGGQLIRKEEVEKLKLNIINRKVHNWNEVHQFYTTQGAAYDKDKLQHAYTALLEILNITSRQFTASLFSQLLQQAVVTKSWMYQCIYDSRLKDYTSPFRKMVYESSAELDQVVGKFEDNTFIQQQAQQLDLLKKSVRSLVKKLK